MDRPPPGRLAAGLDNFEVACRLSREGNRSDRATAETRNNRIAPILSVIGDVDGIFSGIVIGRSTRVQYELAKGLSAAYIYLEVLPRLLICPC